MGTPYTLPLARSVCIAHHQRRHAPDDVAVQDSVFVEFKDASFEQAFVLGEQAADLVTSHFKPPVKLEMEKVMTPLLLFQKKRYVGILFEEPTSEGKLYAKGVQIVRRDACPFVRDTMAAVIRQIFQERNFEAAFQSAVEAANRLLAGAVPVEQLMLSKGLREDYKSAQPHSAVADKIQERQGTLARPRVGDRVPYVYIKIKDKTKACEIAEDPDYVEQQGLQIDYLYYLEHGLKNPLVDLFKLYKPVEAQRMFSPSIAADAGHQLMSGFISTQPRTAHRCPGTYIPGPRKRVKADELSGKITSFFKSSSKEI